MLWKMWHDAPTPAATNFLTSNHSLPLALVVRSAHLDIPSGLQ
jgi:hypothetical protein